MGVFDLVYGILEINREVLERCARELLARETLDEHSIRQLMRGLQLESPCHGSLFGGHYLLCGEPLSDSIHIVCPRCQSINRVPANWRRSIQVRRLWSAHRGPQGR
jgi:hypothetical protein